MHQLLATEALLMVPLSNQDHDLMNTAVGTLRVKNTRTL